MQARQVLRPPGVSASASLRLRASALASLASLSHARTHSSTLISSACLLRASASVPRRCVCVQTASLLGYKGAACMHSPCSRICSHRAVGSVYLSTSLLATSSAHLRGRPCMCACVSHSLVGCRRWVALTFRRDAGDGEVDFAEREGHGAGPLTDGDFQRSQELMKAFNDVKN